VSPAVGARVQVVNQYVAAATDVLAKETGAAVTRGGLQVQQNPYSTEEVTAVIGISGELAGSFYLAMSGGTAMAIVATMLGQPLAEFDELAQSGIAELANVIAGSAGMKLSEDGLETTISPPLMLVGAGARLSTIEIQRLVVPLATACGEVKVHVALRGVG
jgi:chemotaxis protein CheX